MELRGGGVLPVKRAPMVVSKPEEEPAEPIITSSSTVSSKSKNRKDQITERLSRSRRSRFCSPSSSPLTTNDTTTATTPAKVGVQQTPSRVVEQPTANTSDKKIALAKAHKKTGPVGTSRTPSPSTTKHPSGSQSTASEASSRLSLSQKGSKYLAKSRAKRAQQDSAGTGSSNEQISSSKVETKEKACLKIETSRSQTPSVKPRLCLGASPRRSKSTTASVEETTPQVMESESYSASLSSTSLTDNELLLLPNNTTLESQSLTVKETSSSLSTSLPDSLPLFLQRFHPNKPRSSNPTSSTQKNLSPELVPEDGTPRAANNLNNKFDYEEEKKDDRNESPLVAKEDSKVKNESTTTTAPTSSVDVGYLSQWKRKKQNKDASTATPTTVITTKSGGDQKSKVSVGPSVADKELKSNLSSVSSSAVSSSQESKPSAYQWKSTSNPNLTVNASSSKSKIEHQQKTPHAAKSRQSTVAPSAPAVELKISADPKSLEPDEKPRGIPQSPPHVNPWKQMSKVSGQSSRYNPAAVLAKVEAKVMAPPEQVKVQAGDQTAVSAVATEITSSERPLSPFMQQLQMIQQQRSPASASSSKKPNERSPARVMRRWGQQQQHDATADQRDDAKDSTVRENLQSADKFAFNDESIQEESTVEQHLTYLKTFRKPKHDVQVGDSKTVKEAIPGERTPQEEKKDDVEDYRSTPVSVASMKARYGSTASKANSVNRFVSPGPSRHQTPSPVPVFNNHAPSPVPLYPRQTNGRQSSIPPTQQTIEAEVGLTQNDDSLAKEISQLALGDSIETPDRVSVSSMKARFGSTSKASADRAAPSPQPNRFDRLKAVASPGSPLSRSVAKSHTSYLQTQTPFISRSNSFGHARSPSPGLQPSFSLDRQKVGSVKPRDAIHEVAASKNEATADPRTGGIETPDKVNVHNMKARFSQPTISSMGKKSPGRKRIVPSNAASPPVLDSGRDVVAEIEQRVVQNEDTRAVIETPDPVSVQSMKGKFGGTVARSTTNSGSLKSKTPFNSPVSPFRPTPRTDVSTPVGPPMPNRSRSGNGTSPYRGHSSTVGRTKETITPSWVKKTLTQDDESRSETMGLPPSIPEFNNNHRVAPKEIIPPLRPKSPRERPTNIPRWKQSPTDDNPSWRTRTTGIPFLTQTASQDDASQSLGDSSNVPSKQEHQQTDSDETSSYKQENCPPVSPRSPENLPVSPRSPGKRPWIEDVESVKSPPIDWRQSFQSSLDDNREQSKPSSEPLINVTAPAISSASPRTSRFSRLCSAARARENQHGGTEESGVQLPYSLKQMAVDSVHAVDFEQAYSLSKMAKSSVLNEDDELSPQSSEGEEAIPHDLPPEFARSLETQVTDKPKATRVAVRVVDDPASEQQQVSGIVFGDPSTYGAAGGGADLTPPKVKDRALAIANWCHGVRASKSATSHSEHDADEPVLELIETASSSLDLRGSVAPSTENYESQLPSKGSEKASSTAFFVKNSPDRGIRRDTVKSPTKESSVKDLQQGNHRGSSAVLRFWSDNSREDLDGAHDWLNNDPEPLPADSSPEKYMSTFRKPSVDDIKIHSLSDWKRIESPTNSKKSPRKQVFSRDPFPIDTLDGLYEEPVRVGVRKDAAFDPFFDAIDDGGAFDSNVLDFFNASIRIQEPASPVPTQFSPPSFEPKACEDPAKEDIAFDRLFRRSSRESRFSWGSARGGKKRRSGSKF